MNRHLRLAVAAVMALGLAACNMPVTDEPLIPPDAPGNLHFRDGVWSMESRCEGDLIPSGACNPRTDRFRVKDDNWGSLEPESSDDVGIEQQETAIEDGNPAIMQFRTDLGEGKWNYMFMALEVIARDENGALTSAKAWPIWCHPPRDNRKDANPPQLFPGMAPRDQDLCQPADTRALRLAAGLTRRYVEVYALDYLGPEAATAP